MTRSRRSPIETHFAQIIPGREAEALSLAVLGYMRHEIAAKMGIGEASVRVYLSRARTAVKRDAAARQEADEHRETLEEARNGSDPPQSSEKWDSIVHGRPRRR